MKHPSRRRAGALILIAAMLASSLILILFPPAIFLNAALRHYMAPSTSWVTTGRNGRLCFVEGLTRPAEGAEFRIQRLGLTHDLLRGFTAQEWGFEVLNAAVIPLNSRWPSLNFDSGKGRWLSRQRRLELRDWTSSTVLVNADAEWNAQGDVVSARVWGEADVSDLSRALTLWKKYEPVEAGVEPTKKKFEFMFHKGVIFIKVNDKPFFKATWRSNSSF